MTKQIAHKFKVTIQISLFLNDEGSENSVMLIKKFDSEKLAGKFSAVIEKSK